METKESKTSYQLLGWQRIYSSGHIWVARLNSPELKIKAFVTAKAAFISVVFVSAMLLLIVGSSSLIKPLFQRVLVQQEIEFDEDLDKEDLVSIDFGSMLLGAISAGDSPIASIKDFSNDLLNSVVIPLGEGDVKNVSAVELPQVGKPWPVDAVVYKRLDENTLFVGARLKRFEYESTDAGGIWLGMARKQDESWVLFNFTPQEIPQSSSFIRLPKLPSVKETMIPRAITKLAKKKVD